MPAIGVDYPDLIPDPTEPNVRRAMRYLEATGFRLQIAGDSDFRKAAYTYAKLALTARKGLIVTGDTGVGKTHYVDTITRRTHSASPRIWLSLGVTGWEECCAPAWWRATYACDLFAGNLVLDDFGADYVKCSYGTREDLVGRLIMDYHLRGRGRLFVTTNLTPDGIAELRDNRLISRLQGLCLGLNFQGGTKRDMRREGLV